MDKATIRDFANVKGKRVFLRSDLNVSQDKDGNITDDTRIRASLDTIRYLVDKGARVILCSHLGRPKTKADTQYTLKPVHERLCELLPNVKVLMAPDCIGSEVEKMVSELGDGQILLLENIRFYAEEPENDPAFAKKLSQLADYYVNDAFGVSHRAHASLEGITKYLPSVAGFLMEKEIKILGEAISNPRRPLTVIIGGKKVSDKIGVIDGLLKVANTILIGGGLGYTFAKAAGGEVGDSIVDEESIEYCKQVVKEAKKLGVTLVTSLDSVIADGFSNDAHTMIVQTTKIPAGWEGLDIGEKTIDEFKKHIAKSGTIIWCGPLGVFEMEKFANGTKQIANAILESGAVTIIGGGDSVAAVTKFGLASKFTLVSTGGGASLEFLEGKKFASVEALLGKNVKIS
ncbi:MAG: phosphoglycerate kinase [Firmicutes bacterium]|nr:phosphoglycerate kinase [Bacillota bacterium]